MPLFSTFYTELYVKRFMHRKIIIFLRKLRMVWKWFLEFECIQLLFFSSLVGCVNTGFYGSNCNKPCPRNCIDNTCHIQNGTCFTCKPGFTGVKCIESKMTYRFLCLSYICVLFRYHFSGYTPLQKSITLNKNLHLFFV